MSSAARGAVFQVKRMAYAEERSDVSGEMGPKWGPEARRKCQELYYGSGQQQASGELKS
jgi:hypothetical protein